MRSGEEHLPLGDDVDQHTRARIHIHTDSRMDTRTSRVSPSRRRLRLQEPELHRNPGSRLNINSVLNGYISNAGNKLYTYIHAYVGSGEGARGVCVGDRSPRFYLTSRLETTTVWRGGGRGWFSRTPCLTGFW